jgi:hypothetical protein
MITTLAHQVAVVVVVLVMVQGHLEMVVVQHQDKAIMAVTVGLLVVAQEVVAQEAQETTVVLVLVLVVPQQVPIHLGPLQLQQV